MEELFTSSLSRKRKNTVRTILRHSSSLGSPARSSSLQHTLSWLEIQTNKILFYKASIGSRALSVKKYGGKYNTLQPQSSPMGKAVGQSDNQEQYKFIHSPPTPCTCCFLVLCMEMEASLGGWAPPSTALCPTEARLSPKGGTQTGAEGCAVSQPLTLLPASLLCRFIMMRALS